MDYQLAKELKEAGFPQGSSHTKPIMLTPAEAKKISEDILNGKGVLVTVDDPYIPALSELIEACGERFDLLRLYEDSKEWEAVGDEYFNGIGPTPEEAVARLWLALNKKDEKET